MALQPIKKISVDTEQIINSAVTVPKLGYRDYFRIRLTSGIGDFNDLSSTVVDFHNSGTVDFDTSNGWSGDSNNRWQAAEDGIWQFGFSLGTSRNDTNEIRDLVVGVEESTNGSTWTEIFQSAKRGYDGANDDSNGYLSNSYIHQVSAGNYYRLRASANTFTGTWRIANQARDMVGYTPDNSSESVLTFFWGIRIY